MIPCAVGILTDSLKAQQKQKRENPWRKSKAGEEAIALKISGLAPLGYFGGRIGADIQIRSIEKRGRNTLSADRQFREWYISTDATWLHRPTDFEAFGLSAEFTIRRVGGRNGWFWQITPLGFGGNYVLPAFDFETNAPSSGGKLPHPLLDREWYLTPSVSAGIGRDFAIRRRRITDFPMVMTFKIGMASLLPYQTFGYLVPSAELSIGYRFQRLTIRSRQIRRE